MLFIYSLNFQGFKKKSRCNKGNKGGARLRYVRELFPRRGGDQTGPSLRDSTSELGDPRFEALSLLATANIFATFHLTSERCDSDRAGPRS